MRLKTTRAAALVAVGALMMSGCSGGAEEGAAPTAAKAGEKVNLTFWTWAPGMDKIAATWNAANPDIQVTVNKQDGGDPAVTKLLTAIKAGSGAPDLMQTEYQKIP